MENKTRVFIRKLGILIYFLDRGIHFIFNISFFAVNKCYFLFHIAIEKNYIFSLQQKNQIKKY